MRLVGVLLFLFLTVSLFSQSGTRPNQIQGSPYKGGVLVTKAAYYDHARKDTFYIYQHMPIDSLGIVGGADSFYINGVWVYNGDTVTIQPDSLFATVLGGTNDRLLQLRDGSGTVDFDPSSINEIQYIDGYYTGAGASILSPHLLRRVNLSALPKAGFFIPPDFQFLIDEDPYNELGDTYIRSDSLFNRLCQECDELFRGIIDTSALNELGNLRIEGDSIYYQKCPTCVDSLIGIIVHPTIDSSSFKIQNTEINLSDKTTKGYRLGDLSLGPNSKYENTGATLLIKGENNTTGLEIKPDSTSNELTYIKLNASTLQEFSYPDFKIVGAEFDINENMDAPNMVFKMGYNPGITPPSGQVSLEDSWEYSYNLNQVNPADTVVERHIEFRPLTGGSQRLASWAAEWNGTRTDYNYVGSIVKNNDEAGSVVTLTDHRNQAYTLQRWYLGLQMSSENALFPITIVNKLRLSGSGQFFNDDGNSLYFGLNTNRNDFTFYGSNDHFFRLKNDQNTTGFGMGFNGSGWFQLKELSSGSSVLNVKPGAANDLMTMTSTNVGINQTSPTYNLDVTGSGRFTDWTGTGTVLTGRNAAGKMVDFGIGNRFSINSGTLNFTEGDSSSTNEQYGNFLPSTRIAFGSPTDTITSSNSLKWVSNTLTVDGITDIRRTGNNTFISGGNQTQTGTENIALGYQSSNSLTTANATTAIGFEAGKSNQSASNQVSIGYQALKSNISGTGNMAIGDRSATVTTGSNNQAIGNQSLQENTTGSNNVGVGNLSLNKNISGGTNVGIGIFGGYGIQGSSNVAIGYQSLFSTGSKSNNVAIGRGSGFSNLTGSGNIFIGKDAGYNELGSDRLYIDNNSASTDAFILGNMSTDTLRFNSTLSVRDLTGTSTSLGGYTAGNRLSKLTLGTNISITSGTINVPDNLDNDSLNEIQHVDSFAFSAVNTLDVSVSKSDTVKHVDLGRYEYVLNKNKTEKTDQVIIMGDDFTEGLYLEEALQRRGIDYYRYSPDSVVLMGSASKLAHRFGTSGIIQLSPTDSIKITHKGRFINIYALGSADSIKVRSFNGSESFSYAFNSVAKTTLDYSNSAGYSTGIPDKDNLWTSVIKPKTGTIQIFGIVVENYTNIIDQAIETLNADSLYAAKWTNGWGQVIVAPLVHTDQTGLINIMTNNARGMILSNNETIIKKAIEKSWSTMRTTATINSYAKRADDLVDVTLLENRNYQAYQDSSYAFIKNHAQRLSFDNSIVKSGPTGDTIIGPQNIYLKSDSIVGPPGTIRTVDMKGNKYLQFFSNTSPDTSSTTFSKFGFGSEHKEAGFGRFGYENYNIEGLGATMYSDSVIHFTNNSGGGIFVRPLSHPTERGFLLTAGGSGNALMSWKTSQIFLDNSGIKFAPLGVVGTLGKVLTSDASGYVTWQTPATGVTDHGALTGLSDDDHPQYMLKYNGSTSADYNTLTTNGVWRATGSTNSPSGATHSTMFTALQSSGDYGFQIASLANDGFYMRNMTSTFGTWYQLASRTWVGANYHSGSLTSGYIPKATGTLSLNNSLLFDNGTNVGINDNTPSYRLDVNGDIRATDFTGGSLSSYLGRDASGQIIDAATPTATGSAGGDLSGTYPNPSVATSAINSAKILDNSIASGDIQNGTIQAADIAGNTITSAEIDANAIGSSELASTTVSAGSYTNTNITVDADGRITAASNGSASGALTAGTESLGSIPLQLTGSPDLYLTQGTNVNLVRLAANEIEFNVTGGLTDGDKGDITVSSSGATFTVDNGLAATKIADGSVSTTEFQYLNSVTSNVQTQFSGKANVSHTHSLGDLTQSSASTGMVPQYNGSTWVAVTPPSYGLVVPFTNSNIVDGTRLNFTGGSSPSPLSVNTGTEGINLASAGNYYMITCSINFQQLGGTSQVFKMSIRNGSTQLGDPIAIVVFPNNDDEATFTFSRYVDSTVSDLNVYMVDIDIPGTIDLTGQIILQKIF